MDKISVILCTFKEKENIKITLEKLLSYNIHEIIIVDDYSGDGTEEEIKKFNNDKIKFYQRKSVRGFASALIDALKVSQGNYILKFDIDMYEQIGFFFKTIENNQNKDFIIFSRYVEGGDDLRDKYRKIPSLLINKICQFFLSRNIKDYTSGIVYFNKNILKEFYPKNTRYGNFIIEFVYMLILKRKSYIEVPFIQSRSTQENSKSAPNFLKFLYHGILYIVTILNCIILKLKY